MNAEHPKIELAPAEGLIQKLEAILGHELSIVSRECIEATMTTVFQAAAQTSMQVMFEASMLHMRLTQELSFRVLNPTGVVAGMQMPRESIKTPTPAATDGAVEKQDAGA